MSAIAWGEHCERAIPDSLSRKDLLRTKGRSDFSPEAKAMLAIVVSFSLCPGSGPANASKHEQNKKPNL
jgi:hypothetical protein